MVDGIAIAKKCLTDRWNVLVTCRKLPAALHTACSDKPG